MTSGDDWEERLMEQLLQMLATFGIEFDRDDLERMMDLFRNHLENMGPVSYTHLRAHETS